MCKLNSYGESWKEPCPPEEHTEMTEMVCFKITGIEMQASMQDHTGH